MFNKKINEKIDKSRIVEISYIIGNKKEIIKRNLLAGISRGIGIGIGITLISSAIVYLLQKIIKLNIPVLGEYIADIVAIVKGNL